MNELQSLVSMHLIIRVARLLNTNKIDFSILQFAFRYFGVDMDEETLVWTIVSLTQFVSPVFVHHSQKCQVTVNQKFIVISPNYIKNG